MATFLVPVSPWNVLSYWIIAAVESELQLNGTFNRPVAVVVMRCGQNRERLTVNQAILGDITHKTPAQLQALVGRAAAWAYEGCARPGDKSSTRVACKSDGPWSVGCAGNVLAAQIAAKIHKSMIITHA